MKRALFALAAAGLAMGLASQARALSVYRINADGSYTRIAVQWRGVPQICCPNPCTIVAANITANPSDPLDYQIKLAAGDFGDAEGDYQTPALYQATARLPAARGYVIVFDADVFTWDSYNEETGGGGGGGGSGLVPRTTVAGVGCGTGYWDVFAININQTAYYSSIVDGCYGTLPDPICLPDPNGSPVIDASGAYLPGITWAYGGACFGDGTLEDDTGRYEIRLEGDPTHVYFLSVVLDTASTSGSDDAYPSWGTFNRLERCPADFNGDGVITAADFTLFDDAFGEGSLISDLNGDGVLDFQDYLAYANAAELCSE